MALPGSGAISISQVSTELTRALNAGTSLGESAVSNLAGVPSGQISLSNLHGKSRVTAGSQAFYSSGSFLVPAFNTLTVTVYGAGGGGSTGKSYLYDPLSDLCNATGGGQAGWSGGASSFNGNVIGNGGGGANFYGAGAHGTASGGDTNTTGGGAAGGPGIDGTSNCWESPGFGRAGGYGGRAIKTYYPGWLTEGGYVSVAAGASGSPNGGGGYVVISWN